MRALIELLLFISSLSCFVVASRYNTRCFSGCWCDANSIECLAAKFTDFSFLSRINTKDFPDLQYLTIVGAQMGALSDANIFGLSKHVKLERINMSNCGITTFGPKTFSGAPNLQYLYLDGNPVSRLPAGVLQPLAALKTVSFNRIFDADRLNNEPAVRNLLDSPLPALQNVHLSGNSLRFDVGELFCKYKNLMLVDLSSNRLSALTMNCTTKILRMNLSTNEFTAIPRLGAVVEHLDVSDNPLDCEFDVCDEENEFGFVVKKNQTLCTAPTALRGKSLEALIDDRSCGPLNVHLSLLLVALLLCGIAGGIAWKFCSAGRKHKNRDRYDLIQMSDEIAEPTFL